MAPVQITGRLSDFGFQALTAFRPRILFIADGPGFSGGGVLATKQIEVTPNSAGDFTVLLEPATNVSPARTFTVRIEWLAPGGPGESGYVGMDLIERFMVPPQGGAIGDLAALKFDPTSVWAAPVSPANPAFSTWWLNTTTGDLYEWE